MARHGRRVLRTGFFRHPATLVARELLGIELVRNRDGDPTSSIITETEAYEGPHDLASPLVARTDATHGSDVRAGWQVLCLLCVWPPLDAEGYRERAAMRRRCLFADLGLLAARLD